MLEHRWHEHLLHLRTPTLHCFQNKSGETSFQLVSQPLRKRKGHRFAAKRGDTRTKGEGERGRESVLGEGGAMGQPFCPAKRSKQLYKSRLQTWHKRYKLVAAIVLFHQYCRTNRCKAISSICCETNFRDELSVNRNASGSFRKIGTHPGYPGTRVPLQPGYQPQID